MDSTKILLKKMGWNDDLIKHYLLDDFSPVEIRDSRDAKVVVFETNSHVLRKKDDQSTLLTIK